MGQSWFAWKGIDCRSMGVLLQAAVPIVRPEERVKHDEIPGRSGDLTEVEGQGDGDEIYNSYIQTATIIVRGGSHVRDIFRWLRGSGYVTFSGEPDRRQKARIIGAITLAKHSRNLDTYVGEVQFYCQPLKERMQEAVQTVTASGTNVRNNGDVTARPVYKVTASDTSFSVTVGDKTIAQSGVLVGNYYWIDCGTMEVWNQWHNNLLTKNSLGKFPMLAPGDNTLTGAGWSSIEIEKRERYL